MRKISFIFPGQGSQYVGMGKDFYDTFAVARETFEEADDLLGEKLSKIIFEGPVELLTETKYSQLAIFVTSMAIFRVLKQQMPDLIPSVCSGLSLGEYTALCASNRLSFSETLLLVKKRALLMNEACERTSGTMAAVLGLDAKSIELALRDLKEVWVANFNAPGQTVISGTKEGVAFASQVLKEKGARRVLPLSVHGAFHSDLMQSAQEGLSSFIMEAPIVESSIEFVMNVPGFFVKDLSEIRKYLISQVTKSVRWEQGIFAMKSEGVDFFLEIGCGKTLTGLNKKMGITNQASVETVADLDGVFCAVTQR